MSEELDLDAVLAKARSRNWESLEELNAWLATQTRAYNHRPQKRLWGLSPDEARRLIAGDWEYAGPLRLNTALTLSELADARILQNARVVLSALEAAGAVKATASSKNFTRRFVGELIDEMQWKRDFLESAKAVNKVIDEPDVYPLHELRIVLGLAGLIKLRNGKFSVTRKGRDLSPESRAGALYAILFRTYFRSFNLAYLDRYPQNQALQQTLALTFYRLGRAARSWTDHGALADQVLLQEVLEQPEEYPIENVAHGQFQSRVLEPLEEFGLMREKCREKKWYSLKCEFRLTALYDRFMIFDL